MTEGRYQLVRFAPDPVRDEPLNIGIVMTGDFAPRVAFPEDALERAARWCRGLDPEGLKALQGLLRDELSRTVAQAEDIGEAIRPDFLGERFGAIRLSEQRWIDLGEASPDDLDSLFEYLTNRLVRPPKPVAQGGGTPASQKLARALLPAIRQRFPGARLNEALVGHSGRPFTADVFADGSRNLVMSTLVPSSSWQGVRFIEAKAFELYDVGRSVPRARLVACCDFPAIDPEGVREQAELVFSSIDVQILAPENAAQLTAAN